MQPLSFTLEVVIDDQSKKQKSQRRGVVDIRKLCKWEEVSPNLH